MQLVPYLSRCTWDLNDLLAAINLRCDLNDLPAAMDFRQPEVANFRPAGRQFQTAGCQYQQVMRGVQPCQQQEPAECLLFICCCCYLVICRALGSWACQIGIKTEEECREISSLLYSIFPSFLHAVGAGARLKFVSTRNPKNFRSNQCTPNQGVKRATILARERVIPIRCTEILR